MKNTPFQNVAALIICVSCPPSVFAAGQSVPIDYDSLSFQEEPLAVPIGPSTLSASFLIDQGARYTRSSKDSDYSSRANGQLAWGMQLPNSWQAEVQYAFAYNNLVSDHYDDTYTVSMADYWGMVAAGNVTGSVRANTRRTGGTGNAALSNSDFVGVMDDVGAYYAVRLNAYELAFSVDGDGNGEAGITFEQPVGRQSYFWSARIRDAETATLDTTGLALVAQYNYASVSIGAELAYEELDNKANNNTASHSFGSLGVLTKSGAFTLSAEAGLSRQAGVNTKVAALGARVDLARGISLNAGFNHASKPGSHENTVLLSGRYEF